MTQIRRRPAPREVFLAASTPYFRKIKLAGGMVGSVQVQWHDATSAFTIKAYTSNVEDAPEPAAGGTADVEYWHDETTPGDIIFAAATGAAAGCDLVHLGNNGAKWLMLQFDVTANSLVSITAHEKE